MSQYSNHTSEEEMRLRSSEIQNLDNRQIELSSSDFEKILHSAGFVDKTLLIKEFLYRQYSMVMITTPSKFGKSTNADMLKRFCSIEVDENGNRIPNEKSTNYRLFTSPIPGTDPPCKLKISQEKEIIQEHLGTHPVIYIKFHCDTINSGSDATAALKTIVHEAFKDHKYLCNSPKLEDFEAEHCAKWCSQTEHKSFDTIEVQNDLKRLSKYLFRHHGKRVMVICDDYDVMVTSSMFRVESSVLDYILESVMYCLDYLCKDNEYVDCAFITGIFCLKTRDFGCLRASPYELLHGPYWSFYGLTMKELNMLKKRFSLQDEEFNNMVEYYNGYYGFESRNVFNPYSIMSYLKYRQFDDYWSKLEVMNLRNALINQQVKSTVFSMINNTENTYEIIRSRPYSIDELEMIKKVMENPNEFRNDRGLLLFMLHQGYFTIWEAGEDPGGLGKRAMTMRIKIPNKEIRVGFIKKLKEINHVGGVDFEYKRKLQTNL